MTTTTHRWDTTSHQRPDGTHFFTCDGCFRSFDSQSGARRHTASCNFEDRHPARALVGKRVKVTYGRPFSSSHVAEGMMGEILGNNESERKRVIVVSDQIVRVNEIISIEDLSDQDHMAPIRDCQKGDWIEFTDLGSRKTADAWTGVVQFESLKPTQHNEMLTYVNSQGMVCWTYATAIARCRKAEDPRFEAFSRQEAQMLSHVLYSTKEEDIPEAWRELFNTLKRNAVGLEERRREAEQAEQKRMAESLKALAEFKG